MSWTWLGLAVLVLLAFSVVDGYRKGFIKEAVSVLLVLISVVLVWLINPYVNQFLRIHRFMKKYRLPVKHSWILWQLEMGYWTKKHKMN